MGRLLPFILLILVILGLLIGVPLLLQSDTHRAQLADYLSQRLHHKVLLGKLSSGFFPPALQLHDLAVLQDGQDTPLLRIESLDAPLDWGNLLRAKVVPGGLVFKHWVLFVHRRPNGSWDWDEWLSPISQMSNSVGWPVHKVIWHQGECHWVDRFAQASHELVAQGWEGEWNRDGAQVRISGTVSSGLPVAVTYTFEGKGQFIASPQWSGDLRLADEGRQWLIHLEEKADGLDATGQASSWRWDIALGLAKFYGRWGSPSATVSAGTLLGDWKTHLTVQSQKATFHHLASLGGGQTEATGDLTQRPGDIQGHGKVALQGTLRESIAAVLDF